MSTQTLRLESLEVVFKDKVVELLKRAQEVTGRVWLLTDATRTMAEQRKLYAMGRTEKGKVVTNARPGYSAHNYGMAVDLAPCQEGSYVRVDWSAGKKVWELMAKEAIELGLASGFYFKSIFDAPHVEDKRWHAQKELWVAGKLRLE